MAEGYDHRGLPTAGWWAWVVFGLVVFPAVGRQPAAGGNHPAARSPRRWRTGAAVEFAARYISRDLLPRVFLSDLPAASTDWLKKRAAGWAEALRQMQREIVVSVPGMRPMLEVELRREIQCIATGNLVELPWRQPPPSPSRRTTLVQKTIEILRTILVAVLPLGAVLVGQAVLHFNSGAFRWAIITTAVWALLNIVISLDPAVREKIDTARSLAQTLNETRRGNG